MSTTKTMGGLLFGLAATRTSLSDQDPVTRWLKPKELGQINPKAKVAHMLGMVSTNKNLSPGKKERWTFDAGGKREMNRLLRVIDHALAKEPAAFPGVRNVCDLAKHFFEKLGTESTQWCSDSLAFGMTSTVQDLARMGMLILQRGFYGGERLIREDYMYRMSHPSFPDANEGFGYLLFNNAWQNWTYPFEGQNDPASPAPGGPSGRDLGVNWAEGIRGEGVMVHRGLDLVMAVREFGNLEVNLMNTHIDFWAAIRPALVAMDPRFKGDEKAFVKAYAKGDYAPDLEGVLAGSR